MRILICEDEKDLNKLIKTKMLDEGYTADCCFDGEDALLHLQTAEYDAVIMDVMIPIIDGFEVVRRYRAASGKAPVLFLTAKDAVEDRVKGLDIGGNDYLTKPFSFAELAARIRVMMRIGSNHTQSVLKIADLVLNTSTKQVTRSGKNIKLSAREFSLLEYMMYNHGQVLSRNQIEEHLYNFDYEGGTNVIDVYIRYLRKKLDDGFDKKLIHTVRGSGYTIREDA